MVSLKFLKKSSSCSKDKKRAIHSQSAAATSIAVDDDNDDDKSNVTITEPGSAKESFSAQPFSSTDTRQTQTSKNPSMIFERTVQDQPAFSRRNSLLQASLAADSCSLAHASNGCNTSDCNHQCCTRGSKYVKSAPNSPSFDAFSFDSKIQNQKRNNSAAASSSSCCSPNLKAASISSPSCFSPPSNSQTEYTSNSSNVSTPPQNKKTSAGSLSLSPTPFNTAIPAHYILDDYVAPSLDTAVTLQPSSRDQAHHTSTVQHPPSFSDDEHNGSTAYMSAISRKPSIIEMSLNNYLDRTMSPVSSAHSDFSNKNFFLSNNNNGTSLSPSSHQQNTVPHSSFALPSSKCDSSVDPLAPDPLATSTVNSPTLSPQTSTINFPGMAMQRRASLYSSISPYKSQIQNNNGISSDNNDCQLQSSISPMNMTRSNSQDACFSSYADLLNDEIVSQ